MHNTKDELSIKNGALFTSVILLISAGLSGCGTAPYAPERSLVVLTEQDLNYFQIDCKRKQEQVMLLQGQRRSKADVSLWGMVAIGYRPLTKPRNGLVDYQLTELRDKCYD